MQYDEEEQRKGEVVRSSLLQPGIGDLGLRPSRTIIARRDGKRSVPDPAEEGMEDEQQGHVRNVLPEAVVLVVGDILQEGLVCDR